MAGTESPAPATLVGSSSTWYCIVCPPNAERSATPGTDLYALLRIQSCMVLSSIGERSGLSSTYRYTSPDGEKSGATSGVTPSGTSTSRSRSNTRSRAK